MFRSPSLPLHEYDELSSPDPLADSVNDENTLAVARSASPAKRISQSPLRHAFEPTVSTPQRTKSVSDMIVNSPSRTISEQILSPWKIRVTVEAEPEDPHETAPRTRTRTFKIPLRDASSPVPIPDEEHISRGRRPAVSPSKGKRSGTPVRGRSNSRSRRKSLTDLDITVLGDDGDSDDWTKRNSPKKRKARRKSKIANTQESVASDTASKTIIGDADATSPKPRAQKRKSSFQIREDSEAEGSRSTKDAAANPRSPELRTIDLNRVSLRPRSLSTKFRKRQDIPVSEDVPDVRKVSHISVESYPTPESSIGDEEEAKEVSDPTEEHAGFDSILESEGFTMIDLVSIPSARNFLSSPPETRDTGDQAPFQPQASISNENPQKQLPSSNREEPLSVAPLSTKPSAIPSYLTLQADESDISSNVPSSPPESVPSPSSIPSKRPTSAVRHITPPTYSSPKLPTPQAPVPAPIGNKQLPSPTLVRQTIQANAALQTAPSPNPMASTVPKTPSLLSPFRKTAVSTAKQADLFEGFDSGTKRELHAGLQLGEELAKSQRRTAQSSPGSAGQGSLLQVRNEKELVDKACPETDEVHAQQQFNNNASASSTSITRSQRQQVDDFHSLTPDTASTPANQNTRTPASTAISTQARREREWQLEREAISREIENASASKVIVIDSDDENSPIKISKASSEPEQRDEADDDIWLEEAEACNSSSSIECHAEERAQRNVLFTKTEQQRQHDRAKEVVSRPRRMLIPSPWKRGDDVPEGSTFLTNGDLSGMFWQPGRGEIKFGSREIERTKSSLSGSLNGKKTSPDEVELANDEDSVDSAQSLLDAQLSLPGETAGEVSDMPISSDNQDAESENASDNPDSSMASSEVSSIPDQPVKVPVKFNDSTMSMRGPASPKSASPRPGTPPRSAMKGGRLSFGKERSLSPASRRVEFAERVAALHENGSELSESVLSEATPVVTYESGLEHADTVVREDGEARDRADEKSKGWFSWLRPSSKTNSRSSSSANSNGVDGTSEKGSSKDEDEQWQPTKSSLPSTATCNHHHFSPNTTSSVTKDRKATKIPSYLLPPSYPSDPSRNPTIPLAQSGSFTDSHFRSLAIIQAKSSRPRFHAPAFHSCRPGLRQLMGEKWTVDESAAGLGVFEWVVGESEVRVVERFQREVEWGWVCKELREEGGLEGRQEGVEEGLRKGRWKWEDLEMRMVEVGREWGWSERQAMGWLCRVVVGEVVRKEEEGGKGA